MASIESAGSKGSAALKKSPTAPKMDSQEVTRQTRSSKKKNGLEATGEGRRIPTITAFLSALVIVLFIILGLDTSCFSEVSSLLPQTTI